MFQVLFYEGEYLFIFQIGLDLNEPIALPVFTVWS